MRKNLFLIAILIAFSGIQALHAQDNLIDGVVWVVGDDAILKSDVENTIMEYQMYDEPINGDPRCVIPERLAEQKLFLHQAKLDSIEPNERWVSAYLDYRMGQILDRYGSKEAAEDILGPLNKFREQQIESLREQSQIQQMQEKLKKDIAVTPSEIRAYYNKLPKDTIPFIPTTVEVQIITFEPTPTIEEVDAVKKQLREYTDRVTRGEVQFSTLATINSDDRETSRRGGETGFMAKSMLQSEYAAVAFDLSDPAKVSRIVETDEGYYILQLIEKRGDRINVRQILKRPKITAEEIKRKTELLDSLRLLIEDEKTTFEKAAIWSSDKNSRMNQGIMVNTKGSEQENLRYGTSRFEMSELPPDIGKIVVNMNVGDISKPFLMTNDKQKQEIAIVKLKSRVERHKASLTEDFQSIKAMALNQKQQDVLSKWIAKKQKETYIRINDEWKNCDFESDGWVVQK
ncbi:MAG: peptidylprolyl isomerase [Dysgonamonadaceae bacterium]|jgi:peptidyl-prolyl cis-trans isomerase SurA|nr:peptidylprolyl isomerase [Dysgonamonadaceae bacterium]